MQHNCPLFPKGTESGYDSESGYEKAEDSSPSSSTILYLNNLEQIFSFQQISKMPSLQNEWIERDDFSGATWPLILQCDLPLSYKMFPKQIPLVLNEV